MSSRIARVILNSVSNPTPKKTFLRKDISKFHYMLLPMVVGTV